MSKSKLTLQHRASMNNVLNQLNHYETNDIEYQILKDHYFKICRTGSYTRKIANPIRLGQMHP